MSERTAKVESLIRQTVALGIPELAPELAAAVTVTAVDVSPDLKHALVWVGLVADDTDAVMEQLQGLTAQLQRRVAKTMATKYTPRLAIRLDAGGRYADHISRVLGEL